MEYMNSTPLKCKSYVLISSYATEIVLNHDQNKK